jgi:hypothetical protein
MKVYPKDYKGPKAGKSEDSEWLEVREYQAFKWILDDTWTYSDFDCWLGVRDKHHHQLGEDKMINALKDMYRICGIQTDS